eukprot:COSAG06_NODE_7100_length_2634_cov_107.897830_2_plen_41_part_00
MAKASEQMEKALKVGPRPGPPCGHMVALFSWETVSQEWEA